MSTIGGGRVAGQVALVTGAARGQGRSHCLRLAQEGADIVAIDVCADIPGVPYSGPAPADLEETARLVEALDRRAVTAQVDVRDFDGLSRAVEQAIAELGRLDIVSANAGIGTMPDLAVDISAVGWQTMLDINLTGVWHTAKACVPHIIAGGRGGAIVLTSSVAGLVGRANIGHYVAAKHGVVGLMKTLALELAPHLIRVNSVHPTQVDTAMIMNAGTFKLFVPETDNPTREDFARRSQRTNLLPVPWVEPVDISNALLFLASDEARYITGVALPIDAGAVLK
jgi:(+)-trans-carveol dehydrogenase